MLAVSWDLSYLYLLSRLLLLGHFTLAEDHAVVFSHPQEAPKHQSWPRPPHCPQTPELGSTLHGHRETKWEEPASRGLPALIHDANSLSQNTLVSCPLCCLYFLLVWGKPSILIEKSQVCTNDKWEDLKFKEKGNVT